MNKFKFQPPQEHRRSLLPPKNQHIVLNNTLDKCTQILREDRLFIRNQIKNNNQIILDIFKQYARPSQFQNLQIKLRKYVQNIKNQQKAQQLSKFKQSLQSNSTTNLSKRPTTITKPSHSYLKQSIKQNSLQSFNKNSSYIKYRDYKDSRSQQPLQKSNTYLNHSLKHFQDLLKYKLNQDIIEERQSQNVTSARLVRPEYQNNKKPLNQQLYDSNQNRSFNKGNHNNYQIKKQEYHQEPIGHEPINFLNLYKEKTKHQEQPKTKVAPWHFQNKSKTNLPFSSKAQQLPLHSRNKTFESFARQRQQHIQQRQQSIFDKHFDQSDKVSSQHQKYQHNNHNINQFKNIISSLHQSNKIDNNIDKQNVYFQLKDSQIKCLVDENIQKPRSKADICNSNSSRTQQNLFTPQDLLNQCRNFLKNRQSTLKKSHLTPSVGDYIANPSFSLPLSSPFNQKQCLFNRNNLKQQQSSKSISQSILLKTKQQQKNYTFPQIQQSQNKYENISYATFKNTNPPNTNNNLNNRQSFNLNNFIQQKQIIKQYNNLQTFANIYEEKPILSLPSFQIQHKKVNYLQKYKNQNIYRLPDQFSIQTFLENLTQFNDFNPFITVKHFKQFLDQTHCADILKHLLKPFLSQPNLKEIFIVAITQKLNILYNQTHKQYPHNDKQINFIYELLDIDQKGYINRQDIHLFLTQIQQAEVDNYQQVQDELWRLFEGADFTNEQRLSYWHFLFVKNSQQFQKVHSLLSQFQFQIERN